MSELWAELAATEPEVDAVLAAATSSLSRIRPATWVAMLMNTDPTTLHVVASDDADPTMADYTDRYLSALFKPRRAPTTGMSQQVIESGNPLLIPSVPFHEFLTLLSEAGQDYFVTNPPPVALDTVGLLLVPMRVAGATIGTLGIFDWRQAQLLSVADLAWAQPVADQVALALEHARLRAATREQAERLAVIGGIALATRSGHDLQLTLRVIVEQVTARLHMDAADVLLVNGRGNELVLGISAGFHSPAIPDYRVTIDGGLLDPATARPHVEYLADPDRLSRRIRRSLFAREGFETFVGVPLYARNRLVGVLEMYSRSVLEWDHGWLDFLDQLGGVAAAAIDYAVMAEPADVEVGRGAARAPRPNLTDLEFNIMRLIIEGFTNRDISQQVHRSENTIKFHVRRILEKTGAANRTELAHRATREGWL